MLQPNYSQADAESDAGRLLDERLPDVRRRLRQAANPYSWPFTAEQLEIAFPDEAEAQRAERDADQKESARLVIKELVIAALLKPLGDEKSDRAARAVVDGRGESTGGVARVGSIEETLKSLEAEIRTIALAVANAAGKKKRRGVILTGRGSYGDEPVVPINSGVFLNSLECE